MYNYVKKKQIFNLLMNISTEIIVGEKAFYRHHELKKWFWSS